MPKYLIEREVPGAGNLSERDRQAIALKSNRVLHEMGPDIHWLETYISDDHLHCVYIAPNEEMLREHAKQGEFPITRIYEVKAIMDPTTGENIAEHS